MPWLFGFALETLWQDPMKKFKCANERMFTVHEMLLLVMKKTPNLVATILVLQERSKQYTSLSTPERATLSITKLILSNKTARSFIFFYTVILHALVLLVLYSYRYVL
jgi:hypothetical protein